MNKLSKGTLFFAKLVNYYEYYYELYKRRSLMHVNVLKYGGGM